MDPRHGLTSIGSGVTTFFVVTVLVIELLNFEFSAIIALPIGIFAGVAVLYFTLRTFGDISKSGQHILTGYAAFGLFILFLLGLRYVNIGRSVLTTSRILIISLGGAILTSITAWFTH